MFVRRTKRNTTRQLFNTPIPRTEIKLTEIAKSRNEIPIVVIGAGLAGLSAASHLIKHGFTNTIILEATDRLGGRVSSKHFGDTYCELGAKWISIDTSKDSTYELIRQANGLQKKIHKKDEMIYVNAKGERINDKFPELVDMLFRKLCSGIELEKKYKAGVLHDLNNVHTYFHAETSKLIKSMFRSSEQNLANDIFLNLIKQFSSSMGCCLEYVNIEHITKMQTSYAGPIYIPTGMDNLLCHIVSNLDNSQVKLGKPVGFIKWNDQSDTNTKIVGCLDGSVFLADHIICTLPLGVLKNFSKYIFKPMLPKEKLNSIKNLGFGSPIKIYLEYEKYIKPWFTSNIRPMWSSKACIDGLKWTNQIIEISRIPSSRRVLEISVGGAFYEEIEKLPEKEIKHKVTGVLRNCLKNPSVPHPVSVLRSSWSSSACFLGGQPYFSTNSTMTDVERLAKPLGVKPVILFAGDATIMNGFGSIDGARRSGIREAQRIIELYNLI